MWLLSQNTVAAQRHVPHCGDSRTSLMHTGQMQRTALITGASRGLGAAIAVALGAAGMKVAVNYHQRRVDAEQVCAAITQAGGVAHPFQADVRDESQAARLVEAICSHFGEIDVLVLNATGIQPLMSIEEQTWQAHLDQLEFFVKSPLLLVQATVAGMKRRGFGRIINIGSEVFELGNARFANYVAAKGAQLGLTRSWATELAETGITVNLVAPGWIPTERSEGVPQEHMDAYIQGVPMKRMGIPEDVAAMVTFLASDAAGFITGQKFAVNGANTLG
jgi:3-oxoacyl-[acyl-carrier protein] reductase